MTAQASGTVTAKGVEHAAHNHLSAGEDLAADRVLSPPEWTAAVGQQWAPIDEAPYNLYNLLWWIGQRIANRAG